MLTQELVTDNGKRGKPSMLSLCQIWKNLWKNIPVLYNKGFEDDGLLPLSGTSDSEVDH